MATPTLILGANNWAIEEDNILGYALGSSSNQYLPREISFTRGSDATYTDSTGVVRQACWNLLSYSQEFDNGSWFKLAATITTNSIAAPDGTLTADKLIASSANSGHLVYKTYSAQPQTFTFSTYAKKAEDDYLIMRLDNDITSVRTWFNLANGTIGTSEGGSPTITSVGDGWYRCSVSYTPATALTMFAVLFEAKNNNVQNYSGNGVDGIYIWGAQLVQGSDALPYLRTTDRLNMPRVDSSTGTKTFLLEPQRTNVVLWSSDLSQSVWSKTNYTLSSATAIQGLAATRITKNAINNDVWNGTGARDVINTVGTFASGTKAFSVLLRKGNTAKVGLLINGILVGASVAVSCEFDFSTETFTNVSSGLTATFEKPTTDVYRLILVCNETGTGTSKTIWIAPIDSSNNTVTDGYVDVAYFQWELGAYPTTYIPTQATTVTRIADIFSKSNIYTNGYIGQTGGTWFVELRNNIAYTRDSSGFIGIGDTSALVTNSLVIFCPPTSSRLQIAKFISTVGTTFYTTTTDTVKIAIKWNGSTADVFVNGTKVVSATVFTTTVMEFLQSSIQVPAFIQQMKLYSAPLDDAECISITTL